MTHFKLLLLLGALLSLAVLPACGDDDDDDATGDGDADSDSDSDADSDSDSDSDSDADSDSDSDADSDGDADADSDGDADADADADGDADCVAGELGGSCGRGAQCGPDLVCEVSPNDAGGICVPQGDNRFCGGIGGVECGQGLVCLERANCCDQGGVCLTPEEETAVCACDVAGLFNCPPRVGAGGGGAGR